jgi:hypothetical protein
MQGLEEALCAKHGGCIDGLRNVDVTTSIAETDIRKITPSDLVSSQSHAAPPWPDPRRASLYARRTYSSVTHSKGRYEAVSTFA